ncbi:hypothetical protein MLD38_023939 [Melastoma candidum]|uniref:Uncharacterized protein n=1 Tax=Melastoma candidum TaxID=119954 RepID=A0ACB9NQT7_9MYRT|nr:hypothetical protein MLD38_023939 [Melastoma candidum]
MGGDGGALALLIALSLISSAASSRSILVVKNSAPLAVDSSNTTGKVSPKSNPRASQLPSNLSEDQANKSKILDTPTGLDHKSPDVSASMNQPDGKQKVSSKGETKKNEEKASKAIGNKGTCFANPRNCTDQGSLSACIVGFDSGNNSLQLLVENTGDADLKVNHNFLLANGKKEIEVRKRESVKINVSSVPGESIELVLSAGHGDCTLLSLLDFSLVGNVGRLKGWDDDWDEENAVKSPAARHAGNISAHGLTSRGANKDGWENDWDD